VSVYRNAIRTIFKGVGVGRTHLSADVVEQRTEYLCLHGQDVRRVPFVEPVPHELLEERFGRCGCAKVERDGLDGLSGATWEASHGDIFVVVEECAARRHQCETPRGLRIRKGEDQS